MTRLTRFHRIRSLVRRRGCGLPRDVRCISISNRGKSWDRPSPYGERETAVYRSAGACPPRSPACPSDCSSGSPDPERAHGEANPFRARSAGACPPRSPGLRENRTSAKAVSPTEARRGTGPRPTVKYRFFPVARGPVPRDRPHVPEPGEGQALALR